MRVNRTYAGKEADAARGDAGDTRERHPATRVQAPAFNLPSAPPRDYEPAGAEGRPHRPPPRMFAHSIPTKPPYPNRGVTGVGLGPGL